MLQITATPAKLTESVTRKTVTQAGLQRMSPKAQVTSSQLEIKATVFKFCCTYRQARCIQQRGYKNCLVDHTHWEICNFIIIWGMILQYIMYMCISACIYQDLKMEFQKLLFPLHYLTFYVNTLCIEVYVALACISV